MDMPDKIYVGTIANILSIPSPISPELETTYVRQDIAQYLSDTLEEIANQKLSTESDSEDWENGDFEYAYEEFVKSARAALKKYRGE